MLQYYIICAVVGYLIGSIPFGYIIVRLVKGIDIRTVGSGNIGATNALRILGWPLGILVFVLDSVKGIVAMLLSSIIVGPVVIPLCATSAEFIKEITLHDAENIIAIGGLSAIIGHLFPIYLKFKGGKGVATALGVFIVLIPTPTLITLGCWILLVIISRIISYASILSSIILPSTYVLIDKPEKWTALLIISMLVPILIITKHIPNIKRLIAGTEPKVNFRRSKDDKIDS